MKIRATDATGRSEPQFVVYAETEEDRLILKMFAKPMEDKTAQFQLHGVTYEMGKGAVSFNFGWAVVRKNRSVIGRLKKIFK